MEHWTGSAAFVHVCVAMLTDEKKKAMNLKDKTRETWRGLEEERERKAMM